MKRILCTLLVVLAVSTSWAQGLGLVLDGKKVELKNGDSVTFGSDQNNECEVTVEKEGEAPQVMKVKEMTFYGDLENDLRDVRNALNAPTYDMNYGYDFGYGSIMHVRDVMTGDMFVPDTGWDWYSSWAMNRNMGSVYVNCQFIWNYHMNVIKAANKALKAYSGKNLDEAQQQYKGIILTFRALHYLDMARMYEFLPNDATSPISCMGNDVTNLTVPILTEDVSDEDKANLGRATRSEMYNFIRCDLEMAVNYLQGYDRTDKRLPSLACAYGLLARLNMWVEDYKQAAICAEMAIRANGGSLLTEREMLDVKNGFNNLEPSAWMWGVQPNEDDDIVSSGIINWASWMCPEYHVGYASIEPKSCIAPSLYHRIADTDCRKRMYVGTYNEPCLPGTYIYNMPMYTALKFRPLEGEQEYYHVAGRTAYPIMRLEEMLLTYAEAMARMGETDKACDWLYMLMSTRDANYNFRSSDQQQVIDEILLQKRIELWGEGQTFFDIKRLNLPVDRVTDNNGTFRRKDYITTTRPAWMNIVPVRTAYREFKGMIGYENPDPSDLYAPGGGYYTNNNSFTVQVSDGIMNELYGLDRLVEMHNVTATWSVIDNGILLEAPMDYIGQYVGYDSLEHKLFVSVDGSTARIPRQSLGYKHNGQELYVRSTVDGTVEGGKIIFPKRSITVEFGNQSRVVCTKTPLEIYLSEAAETASEYHLTTFYKSYENHASIITIDGKEYLHVYVSRITDADEMRMVCIPGDAANSDSAFDIMATDQVVSITEPGWVDVPMVRCNGDFSMLVVLLRDGIVRYKSQSMKQTYPDYRVELVGQQLINNNNGADAIYVEYNFGASVENAYLALVLESTTEAEIEEMYKHGGFPSMTPATLSYSNEMRSARLPLPKEYGVYKVVALVTENGKLQRISFGDNYNSEWSQPAPTFELPAERYLDITYNSMSDNVDGSVTVSAAAWMSDFERAVVALIPEDKLTGNLGSDIMNADSRQLVIQDGDIGITIANPEKGKSYTLAIAGCDRNNKVLKTATAGSYVLKDNFVSLGWATIEEDFIFGSSWQVELQVDASVPNHYRLVGPFNEWATMLSGHQSPYLEFRVMQWGEICEGNLIETDGLVYFEPTNTGYYLNNYGADIKIYHPSSFFQDQYYWRYNRVQYWKEDGTPGQIQLAPYYYLDDIGGWNMTQTDGMFLINFPGFTPPEPEPDPEPDPEPEDEWAVWHSLGTGLYTDNFVGPLFGVEPIEYEVEIMEHDSIPGLYRVMNPYSNNVYPYAENDCAEEGHYLEIDATDPDGIFFMQQDLCFDLGYGPISIVSEGGRYLANYDFDTVKNNNLLGTLRDGIITLPKFDFANGQYQGIIYLGQSGYYAGTAGEFKVVLPSANTRASTKAKAKQHKDVKKEFNGEKVTFSNAMAAKRLAMKGSPVRMQMLKDVKKKGIAPMKHNDSNDLVR